MVRWPGSVQPCQHLRFGNVSIWTTVTDSLELWGRNVEEVHTNRSDCWGLGHYPSWEICIQTQLDALVWRWMDSDDGILLGHTYDFHLADDTNFYKEHAYDLHESQHKMFMFVPPKIPTRQYWSEIAFKIKTWPLRFKRSLLTLEIIIRSSFSFFNPCLFSSIK